MENMNEFCKIDALIRSEVLEKVELRLQELGVHGYSVMTVKGCGEYTDFYSRECMTKHARVEIYTSAVHADAIAQAIMDVAHSGNKGDGIVAVQPVEKIYRIRLRADMQAGDI